MSIYVPASHLQKLIWWIYPEIGFRNLQDDIHGWGQYDIHFGMIFTVYDSNDIHSLCTATWHYGQMLLLQVIDHTYIDSFMPEINLMLILPETSKVKMTHCSLKGKVAEINSCKNSHSWKDIDLYGKIVAWLIVLRQVSKF